MFVKQASAVIALAAATSAFLLPPDVSVGNVDEAFHAIGHEVASESVSTTISLPCTQCPSQMLHGESREPATIESDLLFDFDIADSGDDSDILLVNGVQIYPPTMLTPPLSAVQRSASSGPSVPVGYEVRIDQTISFPKDGAELIPISFQAVEVAGQFVNGLEVVRLNVIKTPNGELRIVSSEIAPTTNPIINPSGEQCTTLICKWRAMIAERLSTIKPKKGGCRKGAWANRFPSGAPHPHHRHGHPHGRHPHHRGIMRFMRALKSVATHVVIPAILGVAIGFFASVVGMLVGNLVILIWRVFFRRGQDSSRCRSQRASKADEAGEVVHLVEDQEPPPVYEHVVSEKAAIQI